MVNPIDIRTLTIEELSGVVALYPWYAWARVELCRRMAELGALSESQIEETALHVGSRRILHEMVHSPHKADCTDKDLELLAEAYLPPHESEEPRKVYVVGGDYFTQSQYNAVRQGDDGIFSKFAGASPESSPERPPVPEEEEQTLDFCTETLAKIYLEQDYKEQALDIYSRLSLRYPEKSVYFAALIDEIKNRQ